MKRKQMTKHTCGCITSRFGVEWRCVYHEVGA